MGTLAAFRHTNFRKFFPPYVVSLAGIWIQRTALLWLVVDLTESAFYVGLTESLGTLPVLLFTLYAGAVADRVRKERMVMATQIAGFLLALAFAALVFSGRATIALVLGLTFLTGVMIAFDIPARQSFLVELVGRNDLANAIALNATAFNASRVVGPAIAGILIGALGVGICFLLNALSYVPVIIVLLGMRFRRPAAPASDRNALENIVDGLRYVAREPRLRPIVLNIAAFGVFGFSAMVLLPVLAKNEMGLGAQEYGWMLSAGGVGAVIGALGVATFAGRLPKGRLVGIAPVAFGLTLVALAFARSLAVVLAVLVLMGLAMIVTTALTNTLLQIMAPDELRGRVVSVYTVAFVGMAPLGSLLMGVLGEEFGIGAAFATGGVAIIVAASATVLRARNGISD